jgi:hypothetical protein
MTPKNRPHDFLKTQKWIPAFAGMTAISGVGWGERNANPNIPRDSSMLGFGYASPQPTRLRTLVSRFLLVPESKYIHRFNHWIMAIKRDIA